MLVGRILRNHYKIIKQLGSGGFGDTYLAEDTDYEGMAAVKIDNKWGFIDKSGDLVIQPQFDSVGNFADYLAPVKIGNKCGYIDKSGNMVIQQKFDEAYVFSEGLAIVKSQGKYGYIRNPLN